MSSCSHTFGEGFNDCLNALIVYVDDIVVTVTNDMEDRRLKKQLT